jgi:aspartokinase/homoserine dehydrogenase 1
MVGLVMQGGFAMPLLVMKFGGTSVGDAAAIQAVAAITEAQRAAWERVVLVVSAMSGVTDMLIRGATTAASGDKHTFRDLDRMLREKHAAALAELVPDDQERTTIDDQIARLIDEFSILCHSVAVLGELSPRAIDAISSLGERMSVRVVAAALRARGIPPKRSMLPNSW